MNIYHDIDEKRRFVVRAEDCSWEIQDASAPLYALIFAKSIQFPFRLSLPYTLETFIGIMYKVSLLHDRVTSRRINVSILISRCFLTLLIATGESADDFRFTMPSRMDPRLPPKLQCLFSDEIEDLAAKS